MITIVVLAGIMYFFQPQPVWPHFPGIIKAIVAGCAAALGLVALSFKFVFAHELVSWVLFEAIALLGTLLFGAFGYQEVFLLYYVVAFVGIFALGPFLRFD